MRKCIQCMTPIHEVLNVYNLFNLPRLFCNQCEGDWEMSRLLNKEERCPKCLNIKVSSESLCFDCQFLKKKFHLMDPLHCDFKYQGVMKELLHQFKFMRDYDLATVFAKKLKLPKTSYDINVPIPSPIERDIESTFNPVTAR